MKKSFTQRRLEKAPDYNIRAQISGVNLPENKIQWRVELYGAKDNETAARIFERVAEVLRRDE